MLPDLADADAATLRRCLCDVLALSTLPALWAGAQPLRMAESLAAALFTMLSADFVYVALIEPRGGALASVAQTDCYESDPQLAAALGPELLDWTRRHDPRELFLSADPRREVPLRVTCRPLGHNSEFGVLAAGFVGEDLPSPLHHLLLDVGATHATTGFTNALLVHSLRQTEERFRALIEASAQIVWTRASDGAAVEDSPSWRTFTGQTYAEWQGFGWLDAIHPEDRPRAAALWRAAVAEQTPVETEYRLRHASGEWRWTAMRAVPRLDASGAVQELVGMNTDISERKAAEQTQQLLLGELNHRVKNTLANVQAIAQHTLRHAKTPAEFAQAFGGRVQALARVHIQLTEATWQGAHLQMLIRDQVQHVSGEAQQFAVQGPDLVLAPQAALHLALVLHELGTNSRKYGALSKPEGKVTVTWAVKNDRLQLQWGERGGPRVEVPRHRGFGTVLIQSSVRGLGGEAQMVCVAEGLGWEIDLPLEALRAPTVPQPSVTRDRVPGAAGLVEMAKPGTGEARAQGFDGKRILVVEDEVMVALNVVNSLAQIGVQPVGPAHSVEQALAAIAGEALDAALLDANLAGAQVDAVAAALTRKDVPFVFVTGYTRDSLPAAFRNAPILAKPFTEADLIAALRGLFGDGASGSIPLRRRPGAAE
jgi:PAS domain S-box-containing protein